MSMSALYGFGSSLVKGAFAVGTTVFNGVEGGLGKVTAVAGRLFGKAPAPIRNSLAFGGRSVYRFVAAYPRTTTTLLVGAAALLYFAKRGCGKGSKPIEKDPPAGQPGSKRSEEPSANSASNPLSAGD